MISPPVTLSLYDLTAIQSYVFASNRLAANLGASWLSRAAIDDFLKCVAGVAAVPWSGGGNAMVCSKDLVDAREIATKLSRCLHEKAPGLSVVCAHEAWAIGEPFAEVNARLRAAVTRQKQERLGSVAFGGAGVCEACRETGDPVPPGSVDPDGNPAGARIRARLDAVREAEQTLQAVLGPLPSGLVWSRDVDRLGRSRGDRSIIGVVHFDGNGMGKRFEAAAKQGIEEIIELSQKVEEAGREVLKAALAPLLDPKKLVELERDLEHGFALSVDKQENRVVPARPIVYGGDDISLVCDGRLAIDIGARLLRAWNLHSAKLPGGAAHACVGIALVDSHFPFFRAYEMAERLCHDAKQWIGHNHASSASALNWALVTGGGAGNGALGPVAGTKRSTARPYLVCGTLPAPRHRGWKWFREALMDPWITADETRSQIKSLGDALWSDLQTAPTQGGSVERLLTRWKQRGLELPVPMGDTQNNGFIGNETPYLDALELVDRVLPSNHPFWS